MRARIRYCLTLRIQPSSQIRSWSFRVGIISGVMGDTMQRESGTAAQNQKNFPPMQRKLILVDANFDSMYGAQRSMLAVADQLKDFTRVSLVTSGAGALKESALEQGISVHLLQASDRVNTFGGGIRAFGPFRLARLAWDSLIYNLRFARLLAEQSPDWVIANDLRSLLLTAIGARLRRVPVIWYVRDDMRQSFLHGFGVRLADWVVTVSDGVRSVFTDSELKWLGERITTIYTGLPSSDKQNYRESGISSTVADASSAPLVITTVGMLTPRKGQLSFISIAQVLSSQTPRPLKFQIVGSAPEGYEDYRSEITAAVSNARLKPGDSLEMLGWRDDVEEILEGTDILLHPSTGEGLPRILLEALSRHVAVVTYAVSGADEIIPGEDFGFVVPIGDVEAMQNAAIRLINDPQLVLDLKSRGPERVASNFSVDRARKQLTSLLVRLKDNASTRV